MINENGEIDFLTVDSSCHKDLREFIKKLEKTFNIIEVNNNLFEVKSLKFKAFLKAFKINNSNEEYEVNNENDVHLIHFVEPRKIKTSQYKNERKTFRKIRKIFKGENLIFKNNDQKIDFKKYLG